MKAIKGTGVAADEQRHFTFVADGVPVTFPFQPYDIQRKYVECVVRAAKRGQNALLESPTGTGKTLSLLCSSLAWQQHSKEANRKIYYTSRTHIQLNQAAKEMKKTAYAGVPSVVLGSRVHMCLNDEVKSQAHGQDRSINRACHNAIAKNACAYFTNYEQKMQASLDVNKVHDIEDLHAFGKASQCCPYYTSRKLAESKADVVFMPYNYLLDLSIQKTVKLKVNNSIVIFDEGHNIESAFKESASAQFSELCLATIRESCEKLPSKLSDALNYELHGLNRFGYDPEKRRGGGIVDEFSSKKPGKEKNPDKESKTNPIEELAEKLTGERLQQVNKCAISLASCKGMMQSNRGEYEDTKCSVESIQKLFEEAGVNFRTSDTIVETLEAMSSFWSIAGVMSPALVAKYLGAIGNLSHFISIMFPLGHLSQEKFLRHKAMLKDFYSAYLVAEFEKESVLVRSNKMINWSMNLWCLHPAVGLKRVMEETCIERPRSMIITSGTLAPMKPIEDELEVKFPIVHEFDHLINLDQFKILLLGESPNGYSLQSTHKDTTKPRYPLELGESLLKLFKVLPFGTLVFFPSYPLMEKVLKYWKSSRTLWDQMSKYTTIFSESPNQSTFSDDMIRFKKLIDSNQKAVFLGVFRGKLSEGTNLEANHCRSVIIIGLPFPSIKDHRVVETRSFHNSRGDSGGSVWYTSQMRRALAQAIGRVIRSKTDFGMLFLCDPRFTQYKYSLSKWISKFYPDHTESKYEEVIHKIQNFFAIHDIDVSAMCIAEANNSSKGAFEFEAAKLNRKALGLGKPPVLIGGGKSHSGVSAISEENDPLSGAEKIQSDKDKLLSQYRVDLATYRKAQEKKRLPVGAKTAPIESKKPKTSSETLEKFWETSGQEMRDPMNGIGDQEVVIEQEISAVTAPVQTELQVNKPKKASKNIFASRKTNKPQPVGEQCYVCFKPDDLYVTNCRCSRTGHKKCLTPLNNTQCAGCGEKLKIKNFKQLLFST